MHHEAGFLSGGDKGHAAWRALPFGGGAGRAGIFLSKDRLALAQLCNHYIGFRAIVRSAAIGRIITIPACGGRIAIESREVELGHMAGLAVNADPSIEPPDPLLGLGSLFRQGVIDPVSAPDDEQAVGDLMG